MIDNHSKESCLSWWVQNQSHQVYYIHLVKYRLNYTFLGYCRINSGAMLRKVKREELRGICPAVNKDLRTMEKDLRNSLRNAETAKISRYTHTILSAF